MRKRSNAIYYFFFTISLFMVLLVLVVYVFPSNEQKNTDAKKNEATEIGSQYKRSAKQIFPRIESASGSNRMNSEELQEIRKELLGMTVSREYQELHISMVLAIDGYIDFLNTGNNKQADNSRKIVREIKDKNPWLTN